MAEITDNEGGKPKKHSKIRSKKRNLRIDLTPMVDLAFLLITFFMLTTSLSRPMAMSLDKPVTTDSTPVADCRVLNILLDTLDRVFTYEGTDLTTLKQSSFNGVTGIRKAIMEKGKRVKTECRTDTAGKPYQVICIVKLLPGARYKNMIDALDEIQILEIKSYAIQEPFPEEVSAIKLKEAVQTP